MAMTRKSESRSLEAEIAVLPDLDLAELHMRREISLQRPAPKFFRRKFLVRAVAYTVGSRANQFGDCENNERIRKFRWRSASAKIWWCLRAHRFRVSTARIDRLVDSRCRFRPSLRFKCTSFCNYHSRTGCRWRCYSPARVQCKHHSIQDSQQWEMDRRINRSTGSAGSL